MIRSSVRRTLRRATATAAGMALVATGLGLGMAPANAAESVVSGAITDAAGNPVNGFITGYRQQPDGTFSSWEYASVNNGFIQDTFEDGNYKLRFEGYGSDAYSEYYRDKADLATADVVSVAGGAVALAPWTVDVPYVIGTVTDPSGRPVRGSFVTAYTATGAEVASDSTDEKGAFVLPVGTNPVRIRAQGTGPLVAEWYNDKPTLESADPVTGSAAGTAIAIALGGGGVITGRVTSDAGVPLEFVRVSAGGHDDLTNALGVFAIEDVPSGSYTVSFYDPIEEYLGERFNNIPDSDTTSVPAPVVVNPGQVVAGIDATLTPRPAPAIAPTVELTGSVKNDAGVPIIGALVSAWNTPNAPAKEESVTSTRVNRAGVFVFDDLDGPETQYKLLASAQEQGDNEAFSLFSQWFGQRTTYDRATTVTLTPGATLPGADITLMRAGGIEGSITGVTGLPLSGRVTLTSVNGQYSGAASTEVDNSYRTRTVYPGKYKVQFSDNSFSHVPEWWKDSTFEDATVITIKPGQLVSGVSAVLGASLLANERPKIKGYPWVGKSISVDSGMWNLQDGTQFSYEWLIGSTVVGTGTSFTPTKSQIRDKLTVRVLAENGRLSGTATTAATAKIGYQPKVKIKIKGAKASLKVKAKPVKGKKVKGKVVVKEIVKIKKNGDVKYKKIAKGKIKKGKATVSLTKLKKKGKHKLVFYFTGKGKVGSTEVNKKVKIKRKR